MNKQQVNLEVMLNTLRKSCVSFQRVATALNIQAMLNKIC